MRYSKLLIPTVREDPAEAEILSHKLMLRAGMIRKLAAGIYSHLPLGYRVLRKVETIVREEMDRAGAQEILLPAVQPAELWKESGRWSLYGKELMRLVDRHDREFCLGPTHEEVITDLIRREVKSYRQLPLNFYQIQTKFRDEVRPRFGVMRAREFIMKDAYSFDRDEERAKETYWKMHKVYSGIFQRCGLQCRAVEADPGLIGGSFSHEFMVLADAGEEAVACCDSCEYAGNLEQAECKNVGHLFGTKVKHREMKKVLTPEKKSVDEVAQYLEVTSDHLVKTLVYKADGGAVAVLLRGDHEVNEEKLRHLLGSRELSLADQEMVEKVTQGPHGFSGPVGLKGVTIIADSAIWSMANFIVGANEKDAHFVDVNIDRDFKADRFADIRMAKEGDPCPRCDGKLSLTRGIEVGHIFMLGKKYSKMMEATFLDSSGEASHFVMGCYGIGISRIVAAAIEQNHDKNGIIWPFPLAPFQVHIVPVNDQSEKVMITAELIYGSLVTAGLDVLIDDREERPGVKFNDADLLGIPLQIIVGEKNLGEGLVEMKERRSGKIKKVTTEEIIDLAKDLVSRRFIP